MNFTLFFQTIFDGILIGGIYSLIAIGLTLIFGVMNIINFSQGALMMVGMYVTYWCFILFGINPYLSLPISAFVLLVIGMLVQRGVFSRTIGAPEHNQLLITFGITMILENAALIFFSPDFRTIDISGLEKSLSVGSLHFDYSKLIAFLFAIVLTISMFWLLRKTQIGLAIRATSDNRDGALLSGIKVARIDMVTFGIGAALAGIAGTLVTPFLYITPTVGSVFILKAFVVVVLGGLGSFVGALFGGLIIGIAEALTDVYLPLDLKELATFTIFILVLLFRPTGLFGGDK